MNIGYVANSRFPSERAHMTQIVGMCNAFASLGHDVTLLVTDRVTSITEPSEIFFGVPIHFHVARMHVPDIAGRARRIPSVLRPCAFLMQRIVYSKEVRKYIKTHNIEMIYGRDEWILWFLSLFTRVRMVWESHEARYSWAARHLLSTHTKTIVISEGIRDFYQAHGVPENLLHVAHDAVDERFFVPHVTTNEARFKLNIQTTKPVVMYIGGLETWKGAQSLIDAAHTQEFFDVYVIGGKESELQYIRQKYPHIYFLGPRPYKNLPEYQQAADILVIPNTAKEKLGAIYTSPLKLFAHMTAQKPIVASRVPSITTVLTEEEAFFFEPDNPVSLRETLMYALMHREEAYKKAARVYEKSTTHTWLKRGEGIMRFLTSHTR